GQDTSPIERRRPDDGAGEAARPEDLAGCRVHHPDRTSEGGAVDRRPVGRYEQVRAVPPGRGVTLADAGLRIGGAGLELPPGASGDVTAPERVETAVLVARADHLGGLPGERCVEERRRATEVRVKGLLAYRDRPAGFLREGCSIEPHYRLGVAIFCVAEGVICLHIGLLAPPGG